MAELKIVATIIVKSSYQEELEEVFHIVVNETRKEEGNVSYELHQDIQNPLKYIILEIWKSQDAIDKHNGSVHFKNFVASIEGKIDNLNVEVVKRIY